MKRTKTICLLLFVTLSVTCAAEWAVDINCTDLDLGRKFKTIFNLKISVNGTAIALIEEKSKITVYETDVLISNVTGIFSADIKYISAVLQVECKDIHNVNCQVYGLGTNDHGSQFVEENYRPYLQLLGESSGSTKESKRIYDDLSIHLFLSSIFLVYFPFIVMPSLWCACPDCSTRWRNPDKTKFKYYRGLLSGCVSAAFLIWWLIVLYNARNSSQYVVFVVIEFGFLVFYTFYKLIFKLVEYLDDRKSQSEESSGGSRARIWEECYYNARVSTSHGAVTTPFICWLMIRFSPHSAFSDSLDHRVIEGIFWIFAVVSAVVFIFVSLQREGATWKKKT